MLATKYTNASRPGTDPNAAGNHRKSMFQALEASLRRLRTDYIDLYWMHVWDQLTPVEEVMRGLDDLIRQGKVLYVGVSNAPAWWIAQANTIASLRGWSPFVGLQIEYSLVERTAERELLPMCRALGWALRPGRRWAAAFLAASTEPRKRASRDLPMRSCGSLCPSRNGPSERSSRENRGRPNRPVAGRGRAGLVAHREQPVIPIVGARKLGQLQDNLASIEAVLIDRTGSPFGRRHAHRNGSSARFLRASECRSWPTAACAIGS